MNDLGRQIRRYATISWRFRWLGMALCWLICLGGWFAVSMLPNQYESGARLYVDTDAVLTPLLHGIAIESSSTAAVDMLQRTLLSQPNLEKVISKTDLEFRATDPAARERLVQQLSTDIQVQTQTRNLFTITYTNPNPKLARDVVQAVITIFIESATGNNREGMENARQFLAQQIASYEDQLRQAERRRAEFQSRYVDVLPSDANGGVSRLEVARNQVTTLEGQLQDATMRQGMLTHDLQTTPPLLVTETDGGGGGGGGGSSALADAQRTLRQLRLRFTDAYPDVIAARNQVAELQAHGGGDEGGGAPRTAAHSRSVPNPVYEQLRVRLLDAAATVSSLTRQVQAARADRDRLEVIARRDPGLQAEFTNIDRDYTVLRKNYEELLARREAMRIASAADSEADKVKLEVIDPPQISGVPVGPKRKLMMVGVLLAGLGSGVACVLLLAQLDSSFQTTRELRSLNLPVLGGISLANRPQRVRFAASTLGFCLGLTLLCLVFGSLMVGSGWLARVV